MFYKYNNQVNYLITGGLGFIGSHVVKNLLSSGNRVKVLDDISTGDLSNLDPNLHKYEFIDGDIRDSKLVSNLMRDVDTVIHLAASLGVSNIVNKTVESISINIDGSLVVLKTAAELNKRILIASTSEVYGKNPKQPLSEDDDRVIGSPQKIRWSYSDAKAIEESIATSLHLTQGLKVTTIRFFNTVGPRQTGKYGMVLPKFVKSALLGDPIIVHGDGEQTRVFCHVLDAVAGIDAILKDDSTIGEVYNLGGVGEISINDLAKKVIAATNSNSELIHVEYSDVYPVGFEDMQRRVPNIEKLSTKTGWKPTYSLDQIILDIATHMKQYEL